MINDLDARVEAAQKAYADRHPLSRQWFERALRVMPGGNTRSVLHFDPFPIRVTRAETAIIHDVDGHQYVDLAGNYTAGLFGHSPAAIVDAVHGASVAGLPWVHPTGTRFDSPSWSSTASPPSNGSASRTRAPRPTSWRWRPPSITPAGPEW